MRLTPRQVNLLLEALIVACLVTGLGSWMVPLSWARPLTVVHAVSGLSLLVVSPLKIKGPVRTGMRRARPSRWISVAFGVLVLATVALGLLHATGLWFGVGYWTSMWTHLLFGFLIVPALLWHIGTRPVRPSRVDLDRRALLGSGAVAAVAAGVVVAQEGAVRVLDLAGGQRAGTGSHEIASFRPDDMPVVSWINDRAPDLDRDAWPLVVDGQAVDVATIAGRTTPLIATLDCTGGWQSQQRWDVVPLADVIDTSAGRSIQVTSATGYSRLFAMDAAAEVFVATGYDGAPLRRGHGAPLRIVAPGRRGPWWVKWVVSIERSDRPSWLQLPFPAT